MGSTVADAIAAGLCRHGVEVVFGLPGGENVELIAALERAGIQFVLGRHEAHCAWMADGYSRIGRCVGVCLSTLGPGTANLAAGLGHCFLDRTPVLALTAQLDPDLMSRHSHQRLDLRRLFAPVTKLSRPVRPEDDAARVVSEAVRLAHSGRPGPVHLEIPAATLQHLATGTVTSKPEELPPRPVAQNALDRAITRLQRARRPAILAGLGLEPSAPYPLLLRLAESLDAPVVVTPKSKGAIPEEHALYAGVIGLERREPSAALLHQADLILTVGLDPVELIMPWNFENPLIFAAEFPNEDPRLPAEVELIGNLEATLAALAQASSKTAGWPPAEVAAARPADPPPRPERQKLPPSQVVRTVRELLPDDGIATCDVGVHKLLIGKLWPARGPNRFLISNGLSTMGYALPAAIGAKMARPDCPVVCFTGDGGLGMVISEIETAARLRLPVVTVVLADQSMSLIRLKQEMAGHSPTGTLLGPTAWSQIAEGFGARGLAANSVAELKAAIATGLQADGPTLIEATIDASEYRSY